MLAVLSPAKALDFESGPVTRKSSRPAFLDEAARLVDRLRALAPGEVSALMGVSDRLGELNRNRYGEWRKDVRGGRQAALAFAGDVYRGLDARSLGERDLASLQRRVRILSGLYGLLRPLDRIHPHRLEMGTALANDRGRDLYAFWGDRIARALDEELAGHRSRTLVNLASKEYWRAVDADALGARVVHVRFLDRCGDRYRVVGLFAKRARGLMARHIVRSRAETVRALARFECEGYRYAADRSDAGELTFVRDERPGGG